MNIAELSVAEVADRLPQSIEVFERAGIDFSCKGLRSVVDAAASAGYSVTELQALVDEAHPSKTLIRWSEHSVEELTRFLLSEHHGFTHVTVPSVRGAIADAMRKYPADPSLRRINVLFATLAAAMSVHAVREERELFSPFITPRRDGRRAGLSQRILREYVEHEWFSDQMRAIHDLCVRLPRDIAADLQPAIDEFIHAVHYHMHLENNVLYPRVLELENRSES